MQCYMICVAKDSSFDADSNNLTAWGMVEEVQTSNFPARLPFHVLVCLEIETNEINTEFELRAVFAPSDPNAEDMVSRPVVVSPPSARLRIRIVNLELREPGSYRVRVEWKARDATEWETNGPTWPFKLSLPAQPSNPPPTDPGTFLA